MLRAQVTAREEQGVGDTKSTRDEYKPLHQSALLCLVKRTQGQRPAGHDEGGVLTGVVSDTQ